MKEKNIAKNIRIPESAYKKYSDMNNSYGTTMTRIFLKGLEQMEKAYKARLKYASENECVLAFIINKDIQRLDTVEPRRGWYQIVFIKNIVRTSLNTLEVHYLNYQFLDSRKEKKIKKFPIEKVSVELQNIFVR